MKFFKAFFFYFVIVFIILFFITCKNKFGLDLNSYVYHIQEPMDGLFLIFTWVFMKVCVLPSVGIAFLLSLIVNLKFLNDMVAINIKRLTLCSFIIFLIGFNYLVFSIPENRDIFMESKEDYYQKYYTNPSDVRVEFNSNKKNILILSIESMERGYNDYGLIPHLSEYEKNNISFKNYIMPTGANFTMGSNVAIICGIPLLSFNGSSTGSLHRKFLPNITCMSDILYKNGYNLYHFNSGDVKFAGQDKFTETHNYVYSLGSFGNDTNMYEKLKEKIQEIKNENKNYLVWISTMDTHDPTSTEQIKNADEISYNFIEWYRNFDKDSIILVVGDHLMRGNENDVKAEIQSIAHDNRNTVNFIIGYGGKIDKDRVFTYFDFYPTLLEMAGATIEGDKLGLGVSLVSGKKTLVEELGIKNFKEYFSIGGSQIYKSFFREKVE